MKAWIGRVVLQGIFFLTALVQLEHFCSSLEAFLTQNYAVTKFQQILYNTQMHNENVLLVPFWSEVLYFKEQDHAENGQNSTIWFKVLSFFLVEIYFFLICMILILQ